MSKYLCKNSIFCS